MPFRASDSLTSNITWIPTKRAEQAVMKKSIPVVPSVSNQIRRHMHDFHEQEGDKLTTKLVENPP